MNSCQFFDVGDWGRKRGLTPTMRMKNQAGMGLLMCDASPVYCGGGNHQNLGLGETNWLLGTLPTPIALLFLPAFLGQAAADL